MHLKPIKIKISESNPNTDQCITVSASLEKGDRDFPYTIACYGVTDYLTELYFNNIEEAFSALVILVEQTEINGNAEIIKGDFSKGWHQVNRYGYDDAVDFFKMQGLLEFI